MQTSEQDLKRMSTSKPSSSKGSVVTTDLNCSTEGVSPERLVNIFSLPRNLGIGPDMLFLPQSIRRLRFRERDIALLLHQFYKLKIHIASCKLYFQACPLPPIYGEMLGILGIHRWENRLSYV